MLPLLAAGSIAGSIDKLANGAHSAWKHSPTTGSGNGTQGGTTNSGSFQDLLSAHGVTANIQRAGAASALPALDATAYRLVGRVG